MLIDWQNLKAALIAVAIGLLVANLTGCTPQGSTYPTMYLSEGQGVVSQLMGMASQLQSYRFQEQQQQLQEQQLQRQQNQINSVGNP